MWLSSPVVRLIPVHIRIYRVYINIHRLMKHQNYIFKGRWFSGSYTASSSCLEREKLHWSLCVYMRECARHLHTSAAPAVSQQVQEMWTWQKQLINSLWAVIKHPVESSSLYFTFIDQFSPEEIVQCWNWPGSDNDCWAFTGPIHCTELYLGGPQGSSIGPSVVSDWSWLFFDYSLLAVELPCQSHHRLRCWGSSCEL